MGKQIKFWFLVALTTLMVLAGSVLQIGEPLMGAQTAFSTRQVGATDLADQLYVQYPDIPRAPKAQSTLLSRFIDYHLDTQQRPAHYHLDWELSMADYLDVAYSSGIRQSEVASTDKLAMQNLSPQQRHDLIRSLEQHFAQ
ncbi:MAG: hypothetical protein AAGA46_01360 [Cyanobacteria bacterium P01_F01_bin.13]